MTMARLSKSDQLAALHHDALAEFDKIQSVAREERLKCLEDRRFYSIEGAQWEGDVGQLYENRARFEFNHTHMGVIRVINEYRANRIAVDFTPKDGDKSDEFADVCDGLLRADEQASTADEAYDNAFEEAAGGGFGAWRLRACYEDDESEDDHRQRIDIEPIFDADSTVFFDLGAKRQDKSDAKRCYVLTPYTVDAFKEEFDEDPASWPKEIHRWEFDWCTPDLVWVCEYYRVEEVSEKVYWYRGLLADEGQPDLRVTAAELTDERREQLRVTGYTLARVKSVKRRRVRKLLLSANGVLEDEGHIAGRHIPIIPVFGKRWVVDGVERCMGHVRLAKDAQRLMNMIMSWLAEMATRFDMEKPIFTPEQIARHANMWARDNIDRYAFLMADGIKDADGNPIPGSQAPMAYTKVPQIPPAMAALAEMARQALTELLGNQQAGEQMQPNLSGKAVELIQNRLDMQVFIYMSNMAKAMKRSGQVWLAMKRAITVEESRRMKTISTSGEAGSVVVNQPSVDQETGEERMLNDFSKATYDVNVDVGPSSNSLRSAVVRALTGVAGITDDPQTKQALTLATIANLEGEGLGDLREWARRQAVRMGLVKPTDDEKAEMAQEQAAQQPDPQQQYLLAAAKEAGAKATQAEANTVLTVAKAEQARAETAKTLAEIDTEKQQQVIAAVNAFQAAATPPAGMDIG